MEFSTASKDLITHINEVIGTTGDCNINFEVNKKGFLLLKSSCRGYVRHCLTGIEVTGAAKNFCATIPVAQFIGMINRRGDIKVKVTEETVIVLSKNYKAEINIPPVIEVDEIKSSENTLNLTGQTLFELNRHIPGVEITNLYGKDELFLRVVCKDCNLTLLMADNYRLIVYNLEVEGQEDFAFDITLSDLRSLLNIVLDNPDAEFSVEDNRVYARDKITAISYPKQQPNALMQIQHLLGLKDTLLKKKNVETLGDIDLASLKLEVLGCQNIAAEKTTVELTAKGNEFILSYVTAHGRIKTKGSCRNEFLEGSFFLFDPYLFADFLDSFALFETADLKFLTEEKRVFAHFKDKSGYEAFHLCAGH